jgi:MFS family permease
LRLLSSRLRINVKATSTWFALRNPVFRRIWLASVLSGTFLSAQDMSATWLMHDLGASSLSLSLMATAASAPFFLFTLPAGAIADILNRRALIVSAVLWQAACSAFLAFGAWAKAIHPSIVLGCIFVLGIGLAFGAPVWGAIIPDIVDKKELPSAIALGGVQINLSGIVGPALGGFLLPLFGAPFPITVNAVMFLVVIFAVLQWKPRPTQLSGLPENFMESFISSLRYARNSRRMRIILFRNLLFSIVISIVPALLPVIALKEMHLSATQLGLVFTCVGVGSLAGAVFALPYLRQRISSNAIMSVSMAIMVIVLLAMMVMRQLPILMVCAALAGMAWALAGAELWLAGQRVMPGWVRGRMNSFQIMLGQGSIAVGALWWGSGIANIGPELTFGAAATLAFGVLALGHRFSINFAAEASVDAAPLHPRYAFPFCPNSHDGPVTIAIEYSIAREDRQRFYALMQEVQATIRRNGAFLCRLDESLDEPGSFRLEYHVSTWAEYLRQGMRMTVDETQVFNTVLDMHLGNARPIVRYYLSTRKSLNVQDFGLTGRTFSNVSSLSKQDLIPTSSSSITPPSS